MNNFGYAPGDEIFVFSRHGFLPGIVSRVTAMGQVTVVLKSAVVRFTVRGHEIGSPLHGGDYELSFSPSGAEIGGSLAIGNYIVPEGEQEARAESYRLKSKNRKRRDEYATAIDEARKIEVRSPSEVPKAIAALRAIIAKLEEEGEFS